MLLNDFEAGIHPFEMGIRVHAVGEAVQPLVLPLAFPVEQLDALHGTQAFDEGRSLLGFRVNGRLAKVAQHTKQT